MKIIKFGKVDKKYLIPISGGLIMFLYQLFMENFPKAYMISKNPFIANIYFSIGTTLALIPFIISKKRNKNKQTIVNANLNNIAKESKLNVELIYEDMSEEIMTKKNRYNLLSSLLGFTQTLIYNLFTMYCIYNFWFFEIILISIFSSLFLKIKIYKHQYISMILILLLGFGLNVIEYFKVGDGDNKLDLLGIIVMFLSEICFCLYAIISKHNMAKNFCSPYEILIWAGIIGLILNIITLIIISVKEYTIADIKYPNNFFEYFDKYNIYDFIICLVIIMVSLIYNILLLLTIDYFTPLHIVLGVIIEQMYSYFQIGDNLTLNIVSIICFIFITFLYLVYIEIIEINIFNLSDNTKKNIEIRANNEALLEINTINTRQESEDSTYSSISLESN